MFEPIHIFGTKYNKLEPRAVKCLFLGYGSGVKGYNLWNLETKKTFFSRSVVFNESVIYQDSLTTDVMPDSSDKDEPQVHLQVEQVEQVEHLDEAVAETVDEEIVQTSTPVLQQPSIAADRPRRNIVPLTD